LLFHHTFNMNSLPLLIVFLVSLFAGVARSQNPNCALIVPANPLSAKGLSTPFQLTAADPTQGPCHMNNSAQQAFVQGIVLDTDMGNLYVYNPLVIDEGSSPLENPVVPSLPQNYVAALWFGFNGNSLVLRPANASTDSLVEANCVNGVLAGDTVDLFGQVSYCNAPAFFQAASELITSGDIVIPSLGTANDGYPCPTVRDFAVVDQDQSDNVVTSYLLTPNGVAQNTTSNRAKYPNATEIINGSDNFLLSISMDSVLGCAPWKVKDLADPETKKSSLPLDELSAMYKQKEPIAVVPAGDPMTLTNGKPNLQKLNAYRVGVMQEPVLFISEASTTLYCQALGTIAPSRFKTWAPYLVNGASLDTTASSNLYGFLVDRFIATWANLNCTGLLGIPVPMTSVKDSSGLTSSGNLTIANLIPASAYQPGGEFYTLSESSTIKSLSTFIILVMIAFVCSLI